MNIFTLLKKHTSVYALLLALILLITTATGCNHLPADNDPITENGTGDETTDGTTTGGETTAGEEESTEPFPDVEMPSEELKARIRSDYYDYFCELDPETSKYDRESFVAVEYYCGIYNGCVVAMIYPSHYVWLDQIWTQEVGGVSFHYPDSNWMVAWKDGEVLDLVSAHALGWITMEELETAALLYHNRVIK